MVQIIVLFKSKFQEEEVTGNEMCEMMGQKMIRRRGMPIAPYNCRKRISRTLPFALF